MYWINIFSILVFSLSSSELIRSSHRIGESYQHTLGQWSTVTITKKPELTIVCHIVRLVDFEKVLFESPKNKFLIESNREDGDLSQLTLPDITPNDEGQFEVEVITVNGLKSTFELELVVIVPPSLENIGLEIISDVVISEEKDASVPVARCYANGANPPARIMWRSPSINLTDVDIHTGTLMINPKWTDNNARVECIIVHEGLTSPVIHHARITVKFKPHKPKLIISKDSCKTTDTIKLICDVSSSRANPRVDSFRWILPGNEVIVSGYSSILVQRKKSDRNIERNYQCAAINKIGLSPTAVNNLNTLVAQNCGQFVFKSSLIIGAVVPVVGTLAILIACFFVKKRKSVTTDQQSDQKSDYNPGTRNAKKTGENMERKETLEDIYVKAVEITKAELTTKSNGSCYTQNFNLSRAIPAPACSNTDVSYEVCSPLKRQQSCKMIIATLERMRHTPANYNDIDDSIRTLKKPIIIDLTGDRELAV